jgi:lipid-A-disaccharide synthase-like uncharacterized protein
MDSEYYWIIFGLSAQALFFMRFVSSWIVSEKNKKTTIPIYFWYFSIAGALLTLIYSIHRADVVFIVSQSLALLIYFRSLMIQRKEESND